MEEGSDLSELILLPDSCRAAPRFGKNAKALVLAAAYNIDKDFEFEEPPPPPKLSVTTPPPNTPEPQNTVKQTFHTSEQLLDELCKAIPPDDQAFVVYSRQQKMPRVTRQLQVDRLSAKYLIFLLQTMGFMSKEEWLHEIKQNEVLRTTAVSAAKRHEEGIYVKVYNESSYLNKITQERASEEFLDGDWWKQKTILNAGSSSSINGISEQPGQEGNKDPPSVENIEDIIDLTTDKESETQSEIITDGKLVTNMEKEENADAMLLSPAASKTSTGLEESMNLDKDSIAERQAKVRRLENGKEIAVPTESGDSSRIVDVAKDLKSPRAKTHTTATFQRDKENRAYAFIKTILKPLFAAGVIDAVVYKLVAKKVVRQVCAVNAAHRDASFLIDQREDISAFTTECIKHYQQLQQGKDGQ